MFEQNRRVRNCEWTSNFNKWIFKHFFSLLPSLGSIFEAVNIVSKLTKIQEKDKEKEEENKKKKREIKFQSVGTLKRSTLWESQIG